MLLAPPQVVGGLENVGPKPTAATVGALDGLGAVVERSELRVMGQEGANLGLLLFGLLLLGGSGRGGSSGRGGPLNHGPEFGFLRQELLLKLEVAADLVGLIGEPPQFDVLLVRAILHISQLVETGGDDGRTILKTLEIRCHLA